MKNYIVRVEDEAGNEYTAKFTANLINPNTDDIISEAVNQGLVAIDNIKNVDYALEKE